VDKRYSRQEIGKRITERLSSSPTDKPKASMLVRLRDMATRQSKPTTRKRV